MATSACTTSRSTSGSGGGGGGVMPPPPVAVPRGKAKAAARAMAALAAAVGAPPPQPAAYGNILAALGLQGGGHHGGLVPGGAGPPGIGGVPPAAMPAPLGLGGGGGGQGPRAALFAIAGQQQVGPAAAALAGPLGHLLPPGVIGGGLPGAGAQLQGAVGAVDGPWINGQATPLQVYNLSLQAGGIIEASTLAHDLAVDGTMLIKVASAYQADQLGLFFLGRFAGASSAVRAMELDAAFGRPGHEGGLLCHLCITGRTVCPAVVPGNHVLHMGNATNPN